LLVFKKDDWFYAIYIRKIYASEFRGYKEIFVYIEQTPEWL